MSAILKFIRENHILALIEQAKTKKKSRLNLNSFEITDIPDILYGCRDVKHLYLHTNNIILVPMELSLLENLSTLTLDFNNISYLPPEIGNLRNLINLNISYNPLKVLIPEIGLLQNLEALWCNRIGLQEIPKEIGKLENLDTFGARGNELKSLPDEITQLKKLRWLTLENNQLEAMPKSLNNMEALVHCNLKNNQIKEFPMSIIKCAELMYLQLNNNLIATLPEDLEVLTNDTIESIDLRGNPVCEEAHLEHHLLRFSDEQSDSQSTYVIGNMGMPSSSTRHSHAAATQLRMPANNTDPDVIELDYDTSSAESSEDWENSVNSSELDIQYQSEDEGVENEAIGMVLPELSMFASSAS